MKTDINKYIDSKTRNIYDKKTNNEVLKKEYGLTREIIENISREKGEPEWALDIRLKALDMYYKLDIMPLNMNGKIDRRELSKHMEGGN